MVSIEQRVVELLRAAPSQVKSFAELLSDLETDVDGRQEVRRLLHEMVQQGILTQLKGNRFELAEARMIVIGRLTTHRDGYGFVTPLQKVPGLQGDVYIPVRQVGDAMRGDTVMALVDRSRNPERSEGRILKVLERGTRTLVGQIKRGSPFSQVVPDDPGVFQEILVREGDELEAPHDAMVQVEITRFPHGNRTVRGRVIEVLGFRSDFGIDVEIILRKHQIPTGFPPEVLAQVEGFPKEVRESELTGRTDFRSLPIVTIDGEAAKDFDDAVHVCRLADDSFLLGVHIADVSHYVLKGTGLDLEACRRGTSVYFPDRAVPMLPEELSNGICSLRPNEDRLTLSVLMEIAPNGNVQRYGFRKGVIRSQSRMTYTSVARILVDNDPEERARYSSLVSQFEIMRELAMMLHQRRRNLGSIDFDLPEPIIEFDLQGTMVGVQKSERNIAHQIIEEFMLAANETVARHLFQQKVPSLYRIHESPDSLKVLEFNEIASSFGYVLGAGHSEGGLPTIPRYKDRARFATRDARRERKEREAIESLNVRVSSRDYQRLVDQIEGKPEERILSYLMLRSLKQAVYSPQNRGHFGLASACYTHFTSPIRRYPDLLVHRVLKSLLPVRGGEVFELDHFETALNLSFQGGKGGKAGLAAHASRGEAVRARQSGGLDPSSQGQAPEALYTAQALEEIALQSSTTERRAADAERELLQLKTLDFMADKLGDQFEGIVIHISRDGMLVELLDLFIEGFVKISSLDTDDYRFAERPPVLVGTHRRDIFRLGDRLTVAVDRVDRLQKRVELSVVLKEGQG